MIVCKFWGKGFLILSIARNIFRSKLFIVGILSKFEFILYCFNVDPLYKNFNAGFFNTILFKHLDKNLLSKIIHWKVFVLKICDWQFHGWTDQGLKALVEKFMVEKSGLKSSFRLWNCKVLGWYILQPFWMHSPLLKIIGNIQHHSDC